MGGPLPDTRGPSAATPVPTCIRLTPQLWAHWGSFPRLETMLTEAGGQPTSADRLALERRQQWIVDGGREARELLHLPVCVATGAVPIRSVEAEYGDAGVPQRQRLGERMRCSAGPLAQVLPPDYAPKERLLDALLAIGHNAALWGPGQVCAGVWQRAAQSLRSPASSAHAHCHLHNAPGAVGAAQCTTHAPRRDETKAADPWSWEGGWRGGR